MLYLSFGCAELHGAIKVAWDGAVLAAADAAPVVLLYAVVLRAAARLDTIDVRTCTHFTSCFLYTVYTVSWQCHASRSFWHQQLACIWTCNEILKNLLMHTKGKEERIGVGVCSRECKGSVPAHLRVTHSSHSMFCAKTSVLAKQSSPATATEMADAMDWTERSTMCCVRSSASSIASPACMCVFVGFCIVFY